MPRWTLFTTNRQLDRIETATERILMSEQDLDTALARVTGDVTQLLDLVRSLVADHPDLADETASLTSLADSIEAALPPPAEPPAEG